MSVCHKWLLWLWGGLLSVLLCLLFLPVTTGVRDLVILLVATVTLTGLWLAGRGLDEPLLNDVNLNGFPEAPYRLPVVLVCGDTDDFPGSSSVYRTAQGCWIKVPEVALQQTVRQLLWLRPELVSQLAVMACICPQRYDDDAALTTRLLTLRWQMVQVRRDTRRQVPLLLTSTVAARLVTTPLWQSVLPAQDIQVWQDYEAPVSAHVWLSQNPTPAHLRVQILLDAHARFVGETVLPVLTGGNPDMPAVKPAMVLYHQTAGMKHHHVHSLWQRFLIFHTTLQHTEGWLADGNTPDSAMLPDFILPLLPQGGGSTPRSRLLRNMVCLLTLSVLAALCSSAWNNRQLVHRLSFDISQYQQIAMTDYATKVKAVTTLRQDAALLNDWWRNGEPLRYGLGLYRGGLLRAPVLAAIRSYIPPPPPPPPVIKNIIAGPQTVRLDSMSLFDTGQWRLRPGSNKVLINALVGIKAKPGWLIVVTGHTDNTGDDTSNQLLSFKRAQSVRDWMRDTGDVPDSCFAVQGYGESRPLKTNDTPEGRAANRRVEISLVPQADACMVVPDTHHVAPTGDPLKK